MTHSEHDWKSVLVIDDARTFTFDCTYARTVAAAISLLEDEWHEVWFDFDLDRGEDAGPIVDWVVEQVRLGKRPAVDRVIVHSSNPHGARWIRRVLDPHYPVTVLNPEQVSAYLRYG